MSSESSRCSRSSTKLKYKKRKYTEIGRRVRQTRIIVEKLPKHVGMRLGKSKLIWS